MLINANSDSKFSVIITNYPCPAPTKAGQPTHMVRIVPGEEDGAYFTGTYEQCTEAFETFMAGYELYLDNFSNTALFR